MKEKKPRKKKTPKEEVALPVTEVHEEETPKASDNGELTSEHEIDINVQPEDVASEEPTELQAPPEKEQTEEAIVSKEEVDNVAFLNGKIDKLIALKEEKNFSDFWFYVKELNTMIFTLRGVPRQDRLKFKDRISELCEDIKKEQDELKAKIAKTSKIKLDQLQIMLDEALACGNTPEELDKSFKKVEEANKFFREGIVKSADGSEESADMNRHDKEKAKELIKVTRDKIFDRKREVREANFKVITDRLSKIADEYLQKTPRKVFDAIKKLRIDMRSMALDRTQWKEIDNVIDLTWKKAGEKLQAGSEYDSKKKINEFDASIHRKEEFIKTLEKEIKDLDLKWKNVKNDFFKNRVNEWIVEKKEKIEHTRKEIESLKDRAQFMKEKMERK